MNIKGSKIYTQDDINKINSDMSKGDIISRLKRLMRRHTDVLEKSIEIQVENSALKRRIKFLEKRVEILNKSGNYHSFRDTDVTLRRKNERHSKQS